MLKCGYLQHFLVEQYRYLSEILLDECEILLIIAKDYQERRRISTESNDTVMDF